jgi:hypothetical protein
MRQRDVVTVHFRRTLEAVHDSESLCSSEHRRLEAVNSDAIARQRPGALMAAPLWSSIIPGRSSGLFSLPGEVDHVVPNSPLSTGMDPKVTGSAPP